MRVLVYGCGVIGSLTAHALARSGNDVAVLARGKWKKVIDEDGLVIRHVPRMRTTRDRLRTIEALDPADLYDLVVIVMQWTQLPFVLDTISANYSRTVLLIGNNADTGAVIDALRAHDPGKQVLFGFQLTAGHREERRVVSFHIGVPIVAGCAEGEASAEVRALVDRAFSGSGCRLTWERNMAAWLAAHIGLILPVVYLCRSTGFRLTRATWADAGRVLDAVHEARSVLRDVGMPVSAADDADYEPGPRRTISRLALWAMAKTPIGRLAASDHCRSAPDEMDALDGAFERLRRGSRLPMPVWDRLRADSRRGVDVQPRSDSRAQRREVLNHW